MKPRLFAPILAVLALALTSVHGQITVDDTVTFTTSPSNTLQRPSPYTFQVDGTFDPTLEAKIIPGALADFDPTGSDKIIVAFASEGAVSVISITYGGEPMSEALYTNEGGQYTGIYYLDLPTEPGDLVFTFSGSSSNGVGGSLMAVSSTQLGTASVTASSPGQSVAITTAEANSLIVASQANNDGGATAQSPFTALFDSPVGSGGGGTGYLNLAAINTYTAELIGSTSNPVTAAAAFAPTLPRNPNPNGDIVPGGPVPLTWENFAPTTGTDVWVDVWFGTDPNNLTQVVSADPDGLNLTSYTTEILLAGTYYWRVDSYLDGSSTGSPVTGTLLTFTIIDTDSDGLPDDWEQLYFNDPLIANPGDDPDGDTLTNLQEFALGTDPTMADTDGDGLDDNIETNTGIWVSAADTGTDPLNPDTDGDGFLDGAETNTGTWVSAADTGTDPLDADTDADGLLDGVETNAGTFVSAADTGSNPHTTDTDGDGSGDWYEVTASYTDPNDANDTPGVPYPLPDPVASDLGDATKPVKVYIMAGQSNTVGIGYVNGSDPGSLDSVTQRENKFPNLIDGSGNYTKRNDVIYRGVVTANGNNGPLTAGQGADSSRLGPELGFGHVMGWYHDEPVLIIKASQGNRSLGWDYLPPGSERFEVGDRTYAGYGDRPESWLTSEGPVPGVSYGGKEYDTGLRSEADMGMSLWEPSFTYVNINTLVKHNGVPYSAKIAHTSDSTTEPGVGADWETVWSEYSTFNAADILGSDGTLRNLPTDGNDLNGRSYEIAGFCWWQGHKDGGEIGYDTAGVYASRYELNLAKLIDALRNDFNAPNAPVVVATIGFGGGGWDPGSSGDTIFNAQLAVSDPAQYPGFEGTVASVDTTGYWRELAESPGAQSFHYNNNAETYMLVGDAMGRAMLEMQNDVTAPAPNPLTFAIAPTAVDPSTVGMVATPASDVSGPVEYFFENTTNGNTSGWITDTQWNNTGLPAGSYDYRVKARDAVGNEGDWSATLSASPGADVTAPTPDPMSFALLPEAIGENAIGMTATTASDINGVEYYFENTVGGAPDSGWLSDTQYTATGLTPGTEYSYVVRARDSAGNTTANSAPASATTDAPDTTPPSPDPMTFATPPTALGETEITMTATTAMDESGVEYYFEAVTGGGTDSGWQDAEVYTDTALAPDTEYSYRVRARDKSPAQNVTAFSAALAATTDAPDTTAPAPDPLTFATVPTAMGSSAITMSATTATDESGVEYFFEAVSGGGFNSGWQDSPSYTDSGLTPLTEYSYRVRARDKSPNQNTTGWSATLEATTTDTSEISVTNSQNGATTRTTGTAGTTEFSATIADWDLTGGNTVAVFFAAEGSSGFSATFAGEPMTVVGIDNGGSPTHYSGIAYLVNPPATVGDVVITSLYQNGGRLSTVHSVLSLANVGSVAASETRTGDGDLGYTTVQDGGYVLAAAENNNYNGPAPTITGRPTITLFNSNSDGNHSVIHAYGPVPNVGSYIDNYSGSVEAAATVVFEPGAGGGGGSPFGTWADTYPGLTDTTPGLDFDDGGLATALEWVFGGDPTNSGDDTGLVPTFDATSDPDGKLLFIFRRDADAEADPDTTIIVEYGSDLSGWATATHQGTAPGDITISEVPDGFGAGVDQVTVALPPSLTAEDKLFVRLKVVLAP